MLQPVWIVSTPFGNAVRTSNDVERADESTVCHCPSRSMRRLICPICVEPKLRSATSVVSWQVARCIRIVGVSSDFDPQVILRFARGIPHGARFVLRSAAFARRIR